ncbi:MAG: DUF302 domain-containing protein, partial [Pseudomonadota bacterium]
MKLWLVLAALVALPALAGSISPREGWEIHATSLSHAELIDRLKSAVKAEGLITVTRAGPTKAAAARGIEIPDNLVVGVFNNDYAVRTL